MRSHKGDETQGTHFPEAVLNWVEAGRPTPVPEDVAEWLSESPMNEQLAATWELIRLPEAPAEIWTRLRQQIDARERSLQRKRSVRAWPLRAAAVLVVAVGLSFAWSLANDSFGPTPEPVLVSVPAGAMSTVELPGQIVVRLNPESRLSYVPSRGVVEEVRLEGEAYFDVEHNPDRPFRVVTTGGVIEDLGTEFNIRTRDGHVAVGVIEGRVRFSAAGEAMVVAAGQLSTAVAKGPPSAPRSADRSVMRGWAEGGLVFRDWPLREVFDELARRFDRSFELDPALGDRRITAVVLATRAEAAIEVTCIAAGLRCEEHDGGWRIMEGMSK